MLTKANTEYKTFLESQKDVKYNFAGMTKDQQDAEMLKYTTLKIAAAQEDTKNTTFLKEKDAAFEAFRVKREEEFAALQKEWQAKEDAMV